MMSPPLRSLEPASVSALLAIIVLVAGCASNSAIAPSPPGTLLLVAEDATSTLAEIEPNSGHVRHRYTVAGPVVSIALARNGQYAATIDATGEVVVCDLPRQGIDARYRIEGAGTVTALAFADRRSTLVASFDDAGDVRVFGRESGRLERAISTGSSRVIALCPGFAVGEIIAACEGPARLVRLDTESGRTLESVALDGTPRSLARGSDFQTTLVALDVGGHLELWSSGRRIAAAFEGPIELAPTRVEHTIVASEPASGSLFILDAAGSRRVRVASPDPSVTTPWRTALDPSGRYAFVAIPSSERVVVVDVASGSVRGEYTGLSRPSAIAWTFQRAPPGFDLHLGRD